MADHNPIYHLKDSYFFEVPKAMWRHGWQTLDDVPEFLRTGHPDVSDVHAFNHAMDGKILIPQPFAKLRSLYAVESGFGISKYMILEVVLATVLLVVFSRLASKLRSGERPTGWFANLFEAIILFVRDQIARPSIDSHEHDDDHDKDESSLDISENNTSIATVVPEEHEGTGDDHHGKAIEVTGVSAGSTNFKLRLMHDGHADYTSTNNVPITVN